MLPRAVAVAVAVAVAAGAAGVVGAAAITTGAPPNVRALLREVSMAAALSTARCRSKDPAREVDAAAAAAGADAGVAEATVAVAATRRR